LYQQNKVDPLLLRNHPLSDAQTSDKIKTNLFGYGYEGGTRASIGASKKGRIWSHKIAHDISEWLDWCAGVGTKLLDTSPIDLLSNALIPKQLVSRPSLIPLAIEWPEEFYERNEEGIYVEIQGKRVPFFEASLELTSETRTEPIRFRVTADSESAEYEVKFSASGVEYSPTSAKFVQILSGPGLRKRLLLSDWFKREWPTIRYESGERFRFHIAHDPAACKFFVLRFGWDFADLLPVRPYVNMASG